MAVKPGVYPDFCKDIDLTTGVGTVTNPTSLQKNAQPPSVVGRDADEGVRLQEKIPRQLLNWFFGLTNAWIQYLAENTRAQFTWSGTGELHSDDDVKTTGATGTVEFIGHSYAEDVDYTYYNGFFTSTAVWAISGDSGYAGSDSNSQMNFKLLETGGGALTSFTLGSSAIGNFRASGIVACWGSQLRASFESAIGTMLTPLVLSDSFWLECVVNGNDPQPRTNRVKTTVIDAQETRLDGLNFRASIRIPKA